jgi:hypothetical protein
MRTAGGGEGKLNVRVLVWLPLPFEPLLPVWTMSWYPPGERLLTDVEVPKPRNGSVYDSVS